MSGSCEGEDQPLSLEMSQDVQDGVQLQTESLQLSALVLSQTFPALRLRLLLSIQRLPRPLDHLPGVRWSVRALGQGLCSVYSVVSFKALAGRSETHEPTCNTLNISESTVSARPFP